MRVSVLGLGKLGAPFAVILASKGFEVIAADRIEGQVAALHAGRAPVEEPGLQDLLLAARSRIKATTDVQSAVGASEITFVIVPTPSDRDGSFSNDYVLSAIREIGAALRRKAGYHVVVVGSTVMPGSLGGPIRQALERSSGRTVGSDVGLCYNPQFIALGSVINNIRRPDFILIGESDTRAANLLISIYQRVCENSPDIHRMNFVNAEITKIAVNTFVTTKISFANMISEICEQLPDADASAVLKTIGGDGRIGSKYLLPAVGYGGPCFPRDNMALANLARRLGTRADIAEATDAINRRQADRVISLARGLLRSGTVGILGLSYKPDTAVIEKSQAIAIASRLAECGYRVIAHDPKAYGAAQSVLRAKVEVVDDLESCVECADLLIIATPWPAFRNIPHQALRRTNERLIVIDCWRMLPAAMANIVELVYLGTQQGGSEPILATTAV